MSNADLTSVLFLLLLLAGLAHLLGWLFVKMRQPKVVGEILAGVLMGSAVVGRWPVAAHFIDHARKQGDVLDFVYWLGLLLLMFAPAPSLQRASHVEETPPSALRQFARRARMRATSAISRPAAATHGS